ncbi:MAG: hypothetical protein KKB81_04915 [Candidatus Margulisbacteria bacterium]|nr:hypothetical protein [Candidatus Margulisiibacteriota bacterium]MBU1729110.1 hypothetical protein [Candidatus Margulisiibacteriota bacterium]
MYELGIRIIEFTNTSPIFKGGATTLVGVIALIFVLLFMRKTKRTWELGQKVFLALAIFIILYGLYILILQPQWWNPPYELPPME